MQTIPELGGQNALNEPTFSSLDLTRSTSSYTFNIPFIFHLVRNITMPSILATRRPDLFR